MRWASIRGTNMMSATIAFGCSRDALGWLCQRVWFRFAQAICSWCRAVFDTVHFLPMARMCCYLSQSFEYSFMSFFTPIWSVMPLIMGYKVTYRIVCY